MKTVWILTEEYNSYDRYGEYFVAVFENKPTKEILIKKFDCYDEEAEHVLNGGGRIKYEDHWFNLREERCL